MIGSSGTVKASGAKAEHFARLTEPYRPLLLRRARQLTRNRDDAEDLVQDTYLRAYRFFDTFHPENSLQAWLLRIQKNIFINQFRRRGRRQESLPLDRSCSAEELDPPGEGRLHELSPRARLVQEELDEEMTGALERLPETYRQVFFLAAFLDYTYDEIAILLVCPVGTVRSRLSRARDFLRGRLARVAVRYGHALN